MERYYYINLLFEGNKINDTEHGRWKIIGSKPDALESYLDFTNETMLVKQAGCYLINDNHIDLSNEKKYTLSLKYKIEENYLVKAMYNEKEIYSLHWGSGYIKILEFIDNKPYLRINLNGYDCYIAVDYIKNSGWNHILVTCDNGAIRIYYNGIKKKECSFDFPSYKFDYLELGNYKIDYKKQLPIGPIVEYDELVIVNDVLYTSDFDVSEYQLHMLFPEVVYEAPSVKKSTGVVAAPIAFSTKDSNNDNLHSIDIVRRRDYKTDRSRQVSKYKFD